MMGQYIIPAAATIIVAIIEAIAARDRRRQKKREAAQDAREASCEQLMMLLVQSTGASMALGEATARAVQRIPDAHCNGDMHDALDYAQQVKHKQKEFLAQQGIHAMI